jgi:hypothetical protein
MTAIDSTTRKKQSLRSIDPEYHRADCSDLERRTAA